MDPLDPTAPTDAVETAETNSDASPILPAGRPQRTRRQIVSAVFLSALLALGVALILVGVNGASTGRSQSSLPKELEQIQPALGDKVLNQANLSVDLMPGYTGRLIIDGLPFPTVSTAAAEPNGESFRAPTTTLPTSPDDVRFDAGNNVLSFQPRPGGTIERFASGRHYVKVIYWKIIEGEKSSYSYSWYFDVTA